MKTFKEFITEEIRGWKRAAKDLAKARKDAANSRKSVHLHKLKKDGTESKMFDAIKHFSSPEEALTHHENIKKLNPGKTISHNLYIDGKMDRTLD